MKRVIVLYKPEQSGQWPLLDLVLDPVSQRWTGAAAFTGSVQYTLYALDTSGNVALSTNKGEYHQTIAAPIQSGVAVSRVGTVGGSGWFLDATVTVTGPIGTQVTVKVDNGPAQLYTGSFAVIGTGIHIVTAEAIAIFTSRIEDVAVRQGSRATNVTGIGSQTFLRSGGSVACPALSGRCDRRSSVGIACHRGLRSGKSLLPNRGECFAMTAGLQVRLSSAAVARDVVTAIPRIPL